LAKGPSGPQLRAENDRLRDVAFGPTRYSLFSTVEKLTLVSEFHPPWGVHVEQADRSASFGRQAENAPASNGKVIVPDVPTRIEQCRYSCVCRDRYSFGIDTREVRPFVNVAAVASKGEAADIAGATMLPGYDVFDIQRNRRRRPLRHAAILTRVAGAHSNRTRKPGSMLSGLFGRNSLMRASTSGSAERIAHALACSVAGRKLEHALPLTPSRAPES
jgi:hypothetical protein